MKKFLKFLLAIVGVVVVFKIATSKKQTEQELPDDSGERDPFESLLK